MWKDEKGQPSPDNTPVRKYYTHKIWEELGMFRSIWLKAVNKKEMKRHKVRDGLHIQVQGLESTHGLYI